MSTLLHSNPEEHEIEIRKSHEVRHTDSCLEFDDHLSAQAFLRRFMTDALNQSLFRSLLTEDGVRMEISRMSNQEVVDEVARRLAAGNLRAVLSLKNRPTVLDLGQDEEAPPPALEGTPSKTWIKFRVVDDETGQPVPDVVLRLKLPEGTERDYTTRTDGMIEIDEIDPGTCDILAMTDPDALEVVRVE